MIEFLRKIRLKDFENTKHSKSKNSAPYQKGIHYPYYNEYAILLSKTTLKPPKTF